MISWYKDGRDDSVVTCRGSLLQWSHLFPSGQWDRFGVSLAYFFSHLIVLLFTVGLLGGM